MILHLRLCSLCFFQSCNKSLINQSCSGTYWENIGPRSFMYGPSVARSVLSRPRADILSVRPSRLVNKIYIKHGGKQNFTWSDEQIDLLLHVCNYRVSSCWSFRKLYMLNKKFKRVSCLNRWRSETIVICSNVYYKSAKVAWHVHLFLFQQKSQHCKKQRRWKLSPVASLVVSFQEK